MPFYEYRCGQCGHQLEALQRLADAPLRDCPECGAGALERLISAPAFRLKGGGWYETDFKSGAKRNLAESGDAKPDSKPESKPETKATESKPAASKPPLAASKASDPA